MREKMPDKMRRQGKTRRDNDCERKRRKEGENKRAKEM